MSDQLSTENLVRIVGPLTIVLTPDERTVCEVWTRVMGYYRPVSEFNIGKKAEHRERVFFKEPAAL